MSNTQKLTAIILPSNADKTLSWRSDNDAIATVDNEGNVVGLSAGSTKISATTINNLTAECDVVVGQNPREIQLSNSTISLQYNTTQQLTVVFSPSDTTERDIIWTSSDDDIATVNIDGLVTGVGSGTCTITATSVNDLDDVCECTVVVLPTGINYLNTSNEMTMEFVADDNLVFTPERASREVAQRIIGFEKISDGSLVLTSNSFMVADDQKIISLGGQDFTNACIVQSKSLHNGRLSNTAKLSKAPITTPHLHKLIIDYDDITLSLPEKDDAIVNCYSYINFYPMLITSDYLKFSKRLNLNRSSEFCIKMFVLTNSNYPTILFGNDDAVEEVNRYVYFTSNSSNEFEITFVDGENVYSQEMFVDMTTISSRTLKLTFKNEGGNLYLRISSAGQAQSEWEIINLPETFELSYTHVMGSYNAFGNSVYSEISEYLVSNPTSRLAIYSLQILKDIDNNDYPYQYTHSLTTNTYGVNLRYVGTPLNIMNYITAENKKNLSIMLETGNIQAFQSVGSVLEPVGIGGGNVRLVDSSKYIETIGISDQYINSYSVASSYNAPTFKGTKTDTTRNNYNVSNYRYTANANGQLVFCNNIPYGYLPYFTKDFSGGISCRSAAYVEDYLQIYFTPYCGDGFTLLGYTPAEYSSSSGTSYVQVNMDGTVIFRSYPSNKDYYDEFTYKFPALQYKKSYYLKFGNSTTGGYARIHLSSGSSALVTITASSTYKNYDILKTATLLGHRATSASNNTIVNGGKYFVITNVTGNVLASP